jgi:hypothetical protein
MTDLQIEMMVAMCAAAVAAFEKGPSKFEKLILANLTKIHEGYCDMIKVNRAMPQIYKSPISGRSFQLEMVANGNKTRLTEIVEPQTVV